MGKIAVEIADRVMRVEMVRPAKNNALLDEMYLALADALSAADRDPAVRVVLIHGAGGNFTAGNDIGEFLERPPRDAASPASTFIRTIARTAKPLVAAVSGVAVGIGTTMLLHCDVVYAAPDARLQAPFVALGLVPEAGSSFLAPSIAGYQRAAELLLLARPFSAERALAAGFVTEIVEESRLMEHARAAALELAALPPAAVRLTKALLKKRYATRTAEAIDEEGALFRARLSSPEAQEAIRAFLEKRKPDFSKFE